MRLLDVEAVLDEDKGIRRPGQKAELLKELDDKSTTYAILSHRWGTEVSYEDMVRIEEQERKKLKQHGGYQKIIKTCEQAVKDGYKWLWVDTCCIDKRSSSELSEAINSMYRWYQNARVCYAYLNDVGSAFPSEQDKSKFDHSNGWPEWFVRGWTLQELIAPKQVEFFNKDWVPIGNKKYLAPILEDITGIPCAVLTNGLAASRPSVAQIMSWAADRKTMREEDRAYSLMGLFGVNMPMLYGEGGKAFQRLQLEIIRISSDHSIFAWRPLMPRIGSVLAEDPSDFRDSGNIRRVEPDEFGDALVKYIEKNGYPEKKKFGSQHYMDILRGNRLAHQRRLAALRDIVDSQQFHTFTVSNAGIQVFLPVVRSRDSPSHLRAILACRAGLFEDLVTVDLESSGPSFARASIKFLLPAAYPEFKTLHLTHHPGTNEMRHEFALDDKHASYYGFIRHGTYPSGSMEDPATLSSLKDDLIVVVYADSDARYCFAVGLGYYLGQGWVHVICDGRSPTPEGDWTDFAKYAHHRMWNARAEYARNMAGKGHRSPARDDYFIKHAHLPRTIWAARVIWGRWEAGNFKVMVDVEQCPGCCDGPCGMTTTFNDYSGFATSGLMKTVCFSYSLRLDGWEVHLEKCSGQRIALGDYGDYSGGTLTCSGNLFEDMRTLGINPEGTAYCPVVSRVFGFERKRHCMENEGDLAVAQGTASTYLALHQPKGISLPATEDFALLLKALSTRLAGMHLVTTIIQCSDFYEIDEDGKRKDPGGDSVQNSGTHPTEAGILTPLCSISSPQVWRTEMPPAQRRRQL